MKVEALQKYRPLVRPLLFGLVIAVHIIVLVCVRFSVKNSVPEEEMVAGSVLSNAIQGAAKLLKKRSLVFILSDFRSSKWEKPFAQLAQKNDVVAIRITEGADSELPDLGMVPFIDPETSKKGTFPTRSKRFKQEWREANRQRVDLWKDFCIKHGSSPLLLSTEDDAVLVLSRFFKQKSR